MAYLKKDERQMAILDVAMALIQQEGIAAITARRIAQEAGIAVGQIHHHFKSTGQLKAQALLKVTDKLIAQAEQPQPDETPLEKIIRLVRPVGGQEGRAIRRLWNEATFLAERDPDIKQACKYSTEEWHSALVRLLQEAMAAGQLPVSDASELAWRLLALSCGIDNLAIENELPFSPQAVDQHIRALLK